MPVTNAARSEQVVADAVADASTIKPGTMVNAQSKRFIAESPFKN
jgi:hypothetical protein